jgi:hypothetical protein
MAKNPRWAGIPANCRRCLETTIKTNATTAMITMSITVIAHMEVQIIWHQY